MKTYLVSIIIPVYNVEDYLNGCLESVINQTYKKTEIIIIDDGSTDNSGNLCDKFASLDKRIQVFHQKNKGLGPTRNRRLSLATGEYVLFVDSDDYLHPCAIEVLYNKLREQECDLAIANSQNTHGYIPPKELVSFQQYRLSQNELISFLFNSFNKRLKTFNESNFIEVCNKLYKRKILNGLLFKNILFENVDFSTNVIIRTQSAVLLDFPLYYHVLRQTSITHQSVNIRTLDRIKTYYYFLGSIPKIQTKYRGLCLVRLYKMMLHIRSMMQNTFVKANMEDLIKQVYRDTSVEFKKNNTIPLVIKFIILFLYKVPAFYTFYVCFCEILISSIKRKKY